MSSGNNKICSFIRGQVKGANDFLEGVMADVTSEMVHWTPPGNANPIGATYAHVVSSQDGLINGTLREGAPLFASSMAGKTGLSELAPGPDPDNPGFPSWGAWARSVRIDLDALRAYAQAVYAASDEYLASLNDDDLNRQLDLSAVGLGEMSVSELINVGILNNTQWHTGEIACLKGLQNKKGYPF